ncbi:hypothetical protein D3C73_1408940 [compost metagenome]
MNGKIGIIVIPTLMPSSDNIPIASNLSVGLDAKGSIFLAKLSSAVVIVIATDAYILFISFNKSISLKIRLLLVTILTGYLKSAITSNAFLVSLYFLST